MKKIKVLWLILKRTKADRILSGFFLFLFAAAGIIQLADLIAIHVADRHSRRHTLHSLHRTRGV